MRVRTAVALSCLLTACGDDAPADTASQVTVTDSAGITIVQNHQPVWGGGEGWRISTEPVLVIADTLATGDGRYVMNAARLSNGELVLLTDAGGRWFNAAGELLRAFAVQGEGPGEFQYADQLVILAGDTVVVGQSGYRGKLAWFAPDGSFVRDQKIDLEKFQALGRWSECYNLLLPDLSTTNCQVAHDMPVTATNRPSVDAKGEYHGSGPGLLRELRRTFRITPGLDSTIRLGLDISIEQQIVDLPGGHTTSLRHPYHARSYIVAGGSPMRIVSATNPQWELEVWTPEGQLVRKIRRDGGRRVPTALEGTESDALINDSTGFYVRAEPPVPWKTMRDMLEIPDSVPGHAGLVMSDAGEVLSRSTPMFTMGIPSTYDVIDAEGRWLGTITLPPRFRLLRAGQDYLLGVQLDADDVPSVVMYGVERLRDR